MFPNVRLMIAVTFACGVVLVCGIVAFAAFRVTHEPLTRHALGGGPLQLSVEGVEAATGVSVAPFVLRFTADQPPVVRSPFNLSLLQLNGRDPAVTWPDVSTLAPAVPDATDGGEQSAPAATTEAVEISAAEPPRETLASPATPEIAPTDAADVSAALAATDAQTAATPEATPPQSEPPTIVALAPEVAQPSPKAAEPETIPAQIQATPEPPAADEPAALQVATTSDAAGPVAEPVAEPAAERVAALTPAEVPTIELGSDPPTITGKVPLPRVAPATQTVHPSHATPAHAAKTRTAKTPARARVAKAHRVRKARPRAVASGNGQDPFATPSAFQSQPTFQSQFPSQAPMGGPYVGPTQWSR